MAGDDREIMFIIKMRDEANRILKAHGKGWDDAGKAAGRAKVNLDQVARAARDAAAAIAAITVATGTMRKTIGAFAEFEQGMLGVQKTTNFTAAQMQRFSKEFANLAANTAVPIQQMYQVAQAAGQLGVQGQKGILAFTKTVSQMGLATDLAGEEAAQSLARMLNVFNEAPETVGELGDALVHLGNNSAATEAQIARVAQEVALSTSTFQIGTKNAAAIGAAMAELGIRAEIGGTSVGRVFTTIADAAQQGGYSLSVLARLTNMTKEEFAALAKSNPQEAFLRFTQSLGQVINSGGNYIGVLEALDLNQLEINKTIVPLATNYDKLAGKMQLVGESAGALGREVANFEQGINAQLARLGNNFTLLGSTIGGALEGEVKFAIQTMINIVQGLTDAFEAMPTPVQKAIATVIVLGPTLVAAGVAVKATTSLIGLLGITSLKASVSVGTLSRSLMLLGRATPALLVVGTVASLFSSYGAGATEAADSTAKYEEAVNNLNGALEKLNVGQKETVDAARQAAKAHVEVTRAALERTIAEGRALIKEGEDSFMNWKAPWTNMEAAGKLKLAKEQLERLNKAKQNQIALEYRIYGDSRRMADQMKRDAEAASKQAGPVEMDMVFLSKDEVDKFAELLNTIAPAVQAEKQYTDAMQLLEKAAKLTDEQLKELGVTREQLAAVTARGKQALLEDANAWEASIAASERAIAALKVDANNREAATRIMELENEARRQGIELLGAEAMARLEQAKALIQQEETLRRQTEFRDSMNEEIKEMQAQAGLAGLYGRDRERASVMIAKRLEMEKAGIADVSGELRRYMQAWDAANNAASRDDFMEGHLENLQMLRLEATTIGMSGREASKQMELIRIALDAQKAGVQDVLPLLKAYEEAWKQIEQAQTGVPGMMSGINNAFAKFIEDSQNHAQQFEDLTSAMLDGFVDNTVDALFEGKANWSQFFGDIGKMALKMALKNAMGQLLQGFGLGGEKASAASAAAAVAKTPLSLGGSPANPMWVKSVDSMIPGLGPQGAGGTGVGSTITSGASTARTIATDPGGWTYPTDLGVEKIQREALAPITTATAETADALATVNSRLVDLGNGLKMTPDAFDYKQAMIAAETARVQNPLGLRGGLGPQGASLTSSPQFEKMLQLSSQDIVDLKKGLMTEWVTSAGEMQGKGIIDTMLNRQMSGKWGDSMADVLNARKQFSDVNGPPAWKHGRNSIDDLSINDPRFARSSALVDRYLMERAGGAPSAVGDHLNYANRKYSTPNNYGWIDRLEGPSYGRGNSIHKHGTTADLQRFRPGEYGIGLPGGQGAGIDTSAITNSVQQVNGQLTTLGTNIQGLGPKMQQTGTAATTAGTNVQMMGTKTQMAGTNASMAGTNFSMVGTNTQMAGSAAMQAGGQFQQAGTQIQMAGSKAAMAGQQASMAAPGMGGLGSGIMGLMGPLAQAIPGLGSFGQAILQLVMQLATQSLGGGLGGIFGGLFHEGGKVGVTNAPIRYVPNPPRSMKRLHNGNLRSDEFMAVLKRNERVLTDSQEQRTTKLIESMGAELAANRRGDNGTVAGGKMVNQQTTINVNAKDANSFRKSQGQMMTEVGLEMRRMGARNG